MKVRVPYFMWFCVCGHAARGHGPTLTSGWTTRCMHCGCDAFERG